MTNNEYDLIAESDKSTVVAKYISTIPRASHYESEAELEQTFIKKLQEQGYEYISITSEKELKSNLRRQLEILNDITFSDSEWDYFFQSTIANKNQSIEDKTNTIQSDHIKILKRDDGTDKNVMLIDKQNIYKNKLQVINQYKTHDGKRANRYDVTILVNGLPLVHIELKRRGVAIIEAFNQINRYQQESFWADSGLFEYIQLFVISNGTHTKYYSNTTRQGHMNEMRNDKNKKKTSNSFEFTSWWADETNTRMSDIMDFTATFFAKHTLLNILIKYCVFNTDKHLLVMRPYQIVATEKILKQIEISTHYKKLGTKEAGGYIWHTTGSGKTLTSFKTAQLAKELSYVDKVLFVVDRKDLDYQTMKEYDKFEKGSAYSNTSVNALKKQLEDTTSKIIITTIQKLDKFIKNNSEHTVFDRHIVLIFDECHRSQCGDMHSSIIKAFQKYHLFGFTGTPIFANNSSSGTISDIKTTEQVFGKKLHTYTIMDAISDKNVLPFKVDYVETFRQAEDIEDKKVVDIDRERVLSSPERITNIVQYIREHFDQKTMRNSFYTIKERRLSGFNSIFAVSSIDIAKKYYDEFKKQLHSQPSDKQLKIATIFSIGASKDYENDMIDENPEDTSGLDSSSLEFLNNAIKNYNGMFGTSYDTSSSFKDYYKDISKRVKDKEIDILIVVNMFLTGFDATTLNTLWVDKNLRLHGLLQAYSRTNRILNTIKTCGNIVCFRNLEKATNDSIALFGNKEAVNIVLLKSYDDYYNGYRNGEEEIKGYKNIVSELLKRFPIGIPITTEKDKKDFIDLYNTVLRTRNILTTFDKFRDNELLTIRDMQDYHSVYIDLYNEFRKNGDREKEDITDDIIFEMELIKQIDITIHYILDLIKKYYKDSIQNKKILEDIDKAIDSSVSLRNKKDLINQFITLVSTSSHIDDDWNTFVKEKKNEELQKIIDDENLIPEEVHKLIDNAFRDGDGISITGTQIPNTIQQPISRFNRDNKRESMIKRILNKLMTFFDRFYNL